MSSYFGKAAFTRAKRKMSGPVGSILPNQDKKLSNLEDGRSPSVQRRGSLPTNQKTWKEIFAALDAREMLAFLLIEALCVLLVSLGVTDWVLFFKFVVEPDQLRTRATWGGVWVLFTLAFIYFRQFVHSRVEPFVVSLFHHAEIFVATSLVMVFSVNISFYLHVPMATPLKDLGFMIVPEQAVDSKWRPVSDILTAGIPVAFMLQSFFMTRENRCRVISSFFRLATVCYFLRMLTVSVTSLPGPAPHCRLGSPDYYPPQNWIDIVTRVGPMYGNYNSCGDLIFSGHMAYTNSAVLLYLRTLDRHFPRFSRVRWSVGMLYLFVLACLCISGRKHYTVDVVLGLMISTLVFFHFEHSWTPVCFTAPPMANGSSSIQPAFAQDSYPHKRLTIDIIEDDDQALDDLEDDAAHANPANEATGLLPYSTTSTRS